MTARIDEIDNDNLIYVDVRDYDDDEYMEEQARCQEVVEAHVMTGTDVTYWEDRVVIIEDMRRQLRQAATR